MRATASGEHKPTFPFVEYLESKAMQKLDSCEGIKDILVCVTGLTPQVVTETLYALVVLQGRPWPAEIHLITSQEGAERARLDLLWPGTGQLWALWEQYGQGKKSSAPRCDDSTIHVIGQGLKPVGDLRTTADNEAAADTILDVVRGLTAEPGNRLHFSIAGGRKTMTYYLGYCASLLGRRGDSVSHVMVSAPFENMPSFFFPPKKPAVIHDRDNRPHSTKDAVIDLAPVPFIRLRGRVPPFLLTERHSFSNTVKLIDALENPHLSLTLTPSREAGAALDCSVSVMEGAAIRVPAKVFSLLWMFASISPDPETGAQMSSQNWRFKYMDTLMPVYRAITDEGARADRKELDLPRLTEVKFRNELDKLNKALRELIGPGADKSFGVEVASNGKGGVHKAYTYRLRVPTDAIEMHGANLLHR
jgi:CRISPR-associated protein (TIGR02584 family)